jgi:glycosyltransferase involved in cell wall biosynthesis
MAVFNGERHLHAAIESILAQTFTNFEFLIVDDGSTDRSREIILGYADSRIRLLTLPQNLGLSTALNTGLRAATAELIARQDADDVSEPGRLARQVAVMRARPDLALLGSQALAIDEEGRPVGAVWRCLEPASIGWFGLFDNPFAHTSVVFRKTVAWDELGGFDATFDPFSQDYALWCRIMRRHGVANMPDRLVRYRVRASSITGSLAGLHDEDRYQQRFASIVRRIVSENARQTFNAGTLSEREAEQLADLVLGSRADTIAQFLATFERLLTIYLERHPEASQSADFLETLARQFDALAFRVSPPTRRVAQAVYAHGLRHHPALLAYLSWPRVMALCVFGKTGRVRLASWHERYLT